MSIGSPSQLLFLSLILAAAVDVDNVADVAANGRFRPRGVDDDDDGGDADDDCGGFGVALSDIMVVRAAQRRADGESKWV
jgi:hypothetical protein